jgi:hypothetical protein
LGWISLEPLSSFEIWGCLGLERGSGDISEGSHHHVHDVLHVDFNFSEQFEWLRKFDWIFASDAGFHVFSSGSFGATVGKSECFDGLEDFTHVSVNLGRGVTITENIKEITDGYEIESGEGTTLAVQEFVQGFFTDLELFLNIVESFEHAWNRAEFLTIFLFFTGLHDIFHVFVDADELFALLW